MNIQTNQTITPGSYAINPATFHFLKCPVLSAIENAHFYYFLTQNSDPLPLASWPVKAIVEIIIDLQSVPIQNDEVRDLIGYYSQLLISITGCKSLKTAPFTCKNGKVSITIEIMFCSHISATLYKVAFNDVSTYKCLDYWFD